MRRFLIPFLVIDSVIVVAVVAWLLMRQPADVDVSKLSTKPVEQGAPATIGTTTTGTTTGKSATATAPAASDPTVEAPASVPLPSAPAGAFECHGTYRDQPFWLRLSAPDMELNGQRTLQVVYTPSEPAVVSGSIIHDSPVLIVDEHLRLIRWDNRDGATGVLRQVSPDSYLVQREEHKGENEQLALLKRVLVKPMAWPLELAPILAVIAQGEQWDVPVVDFWGERALDDLTVGKNGAEVQLAGISGQVTAEGLTGEGIAVVVAAVLPVAAAPASAAPASAP